MTHSPIDRAVRTILLLTILFVLSSCAAKTPPLFFPSEPAPPRIQLLTAFNNQGSLRDNKAMEFLLGDDYSDQFSKAYGLQFYNGKLYVADSGKGNPGIAVVDFTEKTIKRFSEGATKPVNLAVDTDGTIYACDLAETALPAIVVFDSQYRFIRRMPLDVEGYRPASILIIDDKLYVADVRNNVIRVLNKKSGELLDTIAKEARLGWPVDLTETPDGNIIVTETGAQVLRVLNMNGEVLRQIGSPGDRSGNLSRPKATDVDRDGNVYVVDVHFQNVQIFDQQGRNLLYFGKTEDSNTLIMPAGISISYDNMEVFQPYAEPGFILEYVVAVSSQGGPPNFGSKVTVYGFGKMQGKDYTVNIPESE